jgi:uncharacterized repeat protein (TIGR03806 family)
VTLQQAIDQYPHLEDFCVVDADQGKLIHNPQAVPFDVNTPLFSDYALKYRFVWMPSGAQAQYDPDQPFQFPVGTIFAKTFAFVPDFRKPDVGTKLVETRLLVRGTAGWVALPYVWNPDQSEATLEVGGTVETIDFTDASGMAQHANYLVPQTNQCGQCHDVLTTLNPIGPRARQLNRDIDYDTGAENQLAHWTRTGMLVGAPPPDQAPRLPVWNDPSTGTVEQRARAWLEANCAHCHSANGLARTTGLTLLASESTPSHYGVCKAPIAAGPATGGLQWDIVPGQPDQSILVYRIESTVPAIMMPEVGRCVVHAEGVALVREWISGLQGVCQ